MQWDCVINPAKQCSQRKQEKHWVWWVRKKSPCESQLPSTSLFYCSTCFQGKGYNMKEKVHMQEVQLQQKPSSCPRRGHVTQGRASPLHSPTLQCSPPPMPAQWMALGSLILPSWGPVLPWKSVCLVLLKKHFGPHLWRLNLAGFFLFFTIVIRDARITIAAFQARLRIWISDEMRNCMEDRKQAKAIINYSKTPSEKSAS